MRIETTRASESRTARTREQRPNGIMDDGPSEPVQTNSEVTQPSRTTTSSSYAICMDDIPPAVPSVHNMLGMHVSNAIKQKIIEGQYIDLASLLPPRPGGDEKKLIVNNMGEIISKDANPKKVDTIEQWTDLMFIFAGIYLSGHPAKSIELLKYMQCVRMGANRGAVGWKEYDVQYRLRKAHNPASSWGKVDSELWLMYMTPTSTVNAPQTLPRATSIGKCYNFNFKGSCEKFPCTYTHSCLRCSGQHAMIHCTLAQTHMHNFRAPRFPTQHANNQPRTQQSHFRGPQNPNNLRPRFRFTNPQGVGPRQNPY